MSNNDHERKAEERRPEKDSLKLKAINTNRLGLVPDSMSTAVTNDDIERFLYGVFEEAEVDINEDKFFIKVQWNHKYDQVIKRKDKASGIPPIVVSVVRRFTRDELNPQRNGDNVHSDVHQVEKVLMQIQQNAMRDDSQAAQAAFIADSKLTSVLNMFTRKGPHWKLLNRKKNIWLCRLDAEMVLAEAFSINDERFKNFSFVLDFIKVKEYTTKRDNERHFVAIINKAFAKQDYKSSRKNKFKDLFN